MEFSKQRDYNDFACKSVPGPAPVSTPAGSTKMSWKQIKREGIVVKFRKLLAMVLAVAMIASLAPVLRTTAKAAATWEKVEWTYNNNNDNFCL